MKLVFATNNSHKFQEIRSLMPESYELLRLSDIGCSDEPPETHDTFTQNAIEKADYIFKRYGFPCFADDSGLEVYALGGKPGVYSARYAGTAGNSAKNIKKLLHEMRDITNRKARFKTVIAFIKDAKPLLFEGTVEGEILHEITGNEGFGYDPVFKPLESDLSFAQMPITEKNKISHRAKAFRLLINYLVTNSVH